MSEHATASLNVHTASYDSVIHEASGKEVRQATLCQSGDGSTWVSVARAHPDGAKYRPTRTPPSEKLAFYVISGRVYWRPDDGEPQEWGPGDLVLVSEPAGEIEYTPDHVCVMFSWHESGHE